MDAIKPVVIAKTEVEYRSSFINALLLVPPIGIPMPSQTEIASIKMILLVGNGSLGTCSYDEKRLHRGELTPVALFNIFGIA